MPVQPTSVVARGQFREFIAGFNGRQLGAYKRAAHLAGMTFNEFCDRMDTGQKRCTKCKAWKSSDHFGPEDGRWDGRCPKCIECHRKANRDGREWKPVDELKPSGTPRHQPRGGDKVQARQLVNQDVQAGHRPNPNDLHCALCGHKGSDRRHEYHHHMGYAAEHHYDVISVCSTCHHEEH